MGCVEREEVVIHNLPPRIPQQHPIYSREENEMRVLDIEIVQRSGAKQSYSMLGGLIFGLLLLALC